MGLGLGLTQMAVIAVPISLAWLALSIWLGRSHQRQEAPAAPPEQPLAVDNP
ncbi:hypothetical protein [Frateuria defendens]|uniref:hypothetical protein n=1 Tax=Frateuria defendens TaxID=2219559 RepID=UPI001929CCEC|nr:hypothetical protein [Frateuria defendens]